MQVIDRIRISKNKPLHHILNYCSLKFELHLVMKAAVILIVEIIELQIYKSLRVKDIINIFLFIKSLGNI